MKHYLTTRVRIVLVAAVLIAVIIAVVSSLTACEDSQGRLEDYWLAQAAAGLQQQPGELAQAVEQVTAEQVAAVAGKLQLDAVYFLKGKEE